MKREGEETALNLAQYTQSRDTIIVLNVNHQLRMDFEEGV
jgi:hypothetical protein